LPAANTLTLWGYVGEDRCFVDACLGQAPPPVTISDAFHSIAVLDAAYTSIARGGDRINVARE
jgi:hypothetical protein